MIGGLLGGLAPSSMSGTHLQALGLLAWLAWFLHPLGFLLMLQTLTGAVRLAGAVAGGQASGEPLVWLVVRIVQLCGRGWERAEIESRFGPPQPDRILREPGADLVILSSRARPEWNEFATLQYGDRFFRRIDEAERMVGSRAVIAYRFRAVGENEVIRGLVQYAGLELGESGQARRG